MQFVFLRLDVAKSACLRILGSVEMQNANSSIVKCRMARTLTFKGLMFFHDQNSFLHRFAVVGIHS